jgi:hypothetical protein
MKRPLTTLIGMLAIAGASLAQPALADSRDDRNRLLIGLAIAGLIGLAIHESRNDDRPRSHPQGPAPLPGGCLTRWHSDQGPVDLLDSECLAADYPGADDLPLDCARTIRVSGTFRAGFDPACLVNSGYRLQAH